MGSLRTPRTSSCPTRYGKSRVAPLAAVEGPRATTEVLPSGPAPMSVLLAVLALAVHALGVAAQEYPLVPDTVVQAPGRPALAVLSTGTSGVTALRLAVPLRESEFEAGAGRLLAELALERMRGPAARIGAHVTAERTPWGVAYTVAGAEVDLEYLGFLLRTALEEPGGDPVRFSSTRASILEELERAEESPDDRLVDRLRAMVSPGPSPLAGTLEALSVLTAPQLREVWRRSHTSASIQIVAATALEPAVLLAGLTGIGHPFDSLAIPREEGTMRRSDRTAPPLLRNRYGLAWVGDETLDPHAAVVWSLLAQRLQDPPQGIEARARLIQFQRGHAIFLTGTTRGRDTGLRTFLDGLLPALEADITAGSVRDAALEIRHRYNVTASSPVGLVDRVGRALEATGQTGAAAEYVARLDAVTRESLLSYLGALQGPMTETLGR